MEQKRPFTDRLRALLDSENVLSQKEIAKQLGYDKPNIISMFRTGAMKVPFAKIPALAKALGADPGHLMRLALQEYAPELLEVFDATAGGPMARDEHALLAAHRSVTKGQETDLPDTFYVEYRTFLRRHL